MFNTKVLAIVLLIAVSSNIQTTSAQSGGPKPTDSKKLSSKQVASTSKSSKSAKTTKTSSKQVASTKTSSKLTTSTKSSSKLITSTKPSSKLSTSAKSSSKQGASTKTSSKEVASTKIPSKEVASTKTPSKEVASTKTPSKEVLVTKTSAMQITPLKTSAKQIASSKTTTEPNSKDTPLKPLSLKEASTSSVPTGTSQSNVTQVAFKETSTKQDEIAATLTAVNLIKEKQTITDIHRETTVAYSPKLIDVTDQTIRLGAGKKEELLFGFAAGDKIIFNFEEVNDKEVKEIEVIEYPSLSRYSDYKITRIKDKEIIVSKQSVFIFRLKNSSLAKRICKLKIQRIPASQALESFNSSVSWITKQDTVWNSYTTSVVVGYDTTYVARTKKVLIRSEVEEQVISDDIKRISPQQKIDNRTSLVLTLPLNIRSPYRTSRVIGWAYWMGVGPEANRAWQQNLRSVRTNNMDYYTPLGAYANGGINYLVIPKTGDQVSYFIADQDNRDLFMQKQPFKYIDEGKGFGGYKKFTRPDQCQGSYYLCLENLNLLGYADVTVKVVALVEKSYYEDQAYEEQIIKPLTETQIKQQPSIINTNLPVTGI